MSTTVYLSNVPSFCQEQDVYRGLLSFGSATEVQINRQNNTAVVTMRTSHEAQALRNHHTVNIMGSMVTVNAVAMPQPQQPYGGTGGYQNCVSPVPQQGSLLGAARPRLHFVVENCTYPVTRPLLMQLFNMVAPPTQLYCGPSGPTTSGEVEFQDQQTTDRVMQELNNKFIYPDCCLMRLYCDQPSQPRMPQMSMPMQQQHQPQQQQQQQQPMPSHAVPQPQPQPLQQQQMPQQMGHQQFYGSFDPMYGGNMIQPQQQAQQPQHQPQAQQQPMGLPPHHQQQQPMGSGQYGSQQPFMYDGSGHSHANNDPNNHSGMGPYDGANMMMTPPGPAFRGGRGGRGAGPMIMRGRGGGRGDGMVFDPMAGPGYGQGPAGFIGGRGGGPGGEVPPPIQQDGTVMVSNVAETVPLHDLWILLEVYGNVNSLKRMFKEKTSVVAQFQHAVDARNAVFNLHGCRFRGRALALKHFAGYVERGRVEWNTGPAKDPSTQAVLFTSGYHHRTKPNAPFNAQGRVRPEKYLYISNLTADISDSTVKDLLTSAKSGGPSREVIKLFRKNETAAIAEFKDVETSVDALIASHAHQIKDRYLRVTFSRHSPDAPAHDDQAGDASEKKAAKPTAATQDGGEAAEAGVATKAEATAPSTSETA